MRHADAGDHCRVSQDGWRTGEVVEESNSGAKEDRPDVDAELVEEAGIQQLLDGIGAMDSNGLSGGGGFRLAHCALDAVRHEVHSRVGSRPSGGDVVSQYECWSPGVISGRLAAEPRRSRHDLGRKLRQARAYAVVRSTIER